MNLETRTFLTDKKEVRLDAYVPTLYIGLGGTGRDVLLRLRKRWFHEHGPRRPPFVRYLMVDMGTPCSWPRGTRQEDYESVRPEPGEWVNCEIPANQFYAVFDGLAKTRDERFAGWLKPELQFYGAACMASGSGTHRQLGRLAFMLRYDELRERIEVQLRQMLEDVLRLHLDVPPSTHVQTGEIEVVIVTSLAGGAGSGMFLDTAYLVQDILRSSPVFRGLARRQVTVIAVLPAAFQALLDAGQYRKLQQNAYAALLEMEHYGTPYTADDLFLGRRRQADDRNRVGFVAPWKQGDRQKVNYPFRARFGMMVIS